MATISGTLFNATSPRPNVTIMLVATRTTASVINTATDISITTDANGVYSFDCNPSAYLVMLIENGSGKQVGYIQVYSDSVEGTLEQYLTNFNPDILTPDVVREVKEAAASALESMNNAKISETNAASDAGQSAIDAKTASDSAGLAKGYSGTAKSDSESATASATTATEKAAEAKNSAGIASDSMNFKTETILIPKWESPQVNFVQATKTFVFKLQDLSIYKLTPAVWDMTNRVMVSFSRSTKAWWNGVEYGINVPRIKDGKLLVEAQATNSVFFSSPENGAESSVNGANSLLFFGNDNSFTLSRPIAGICFFYTANIKIENKRTHTIVRTESAEDLVFGRSADMSADLTVSKFLYLYVNNLDGTHYIITGNGLLKYPDNTDRPVTVTHIEVNDIDMRLTSLIPTNGTAVTRAADIATVRDKT